MKCILIEVQKLLGKKWTIEILQDLYHRGELGFNELHKNIKIATNKILSDRLHDLEKEKLVSRKTMQEKPLRVHYKLTDKGKDLMNVFDEFKKWGMKYKMVPECCDKRNCAQCLKL